MHHVFLPEAPLPEDVLWNYTMISTISLSVFHVN